MKLHKKTVLVTGASSGIGQAIAIACAMEGSHVIVHYRNNKSGAQKTLTEIEKTSKGTIVRADLTQPTEIKAMFQNIDSVDALVNCAGDARSGGFDSEKNWKYEWENIFMSQVRVTNEFLTCTSSQKIRNIVNISSVYGLVDMGNPDFPQYSACKAAINSFTCTLAKKLAPHVLVNAVAPGYTWTPAWNGTPQTELDACTNLTKIKRFVTPEEVASVVVALLENDAMTGEIIRVDGGLHLLNLR